jgi:hypothetical protein
MFNSFSIPTDPAREGMTSDAVPQGARRSIHKECGGVVMQQRVKVTAAQGKRNVDTENEGITSTPQACRRKGLLAQKMSDKEDTALLPHRREKRV